MSRSRAWGFTPAAERTVELCRRLSRDAGVSEDWSAVLLFSLLRDESLASACLRDCGIGAGDLGAVLPAGVSVEGVWGFAEQIESEGSGCGVARGLTDSADPECFRRLLERAREVARRETRDGAITSAVLLLAVYEHSAELRVIFGSRGISGQQLQQRLFPGEEVERLVLEPGELVLGAGECEVGGCEVGGCGEVGERPELWDGGLGDGVLRVLDAGLNRAREGLRVLEDYSRFVCDDGVAAVELKRLRHELCEAEQGVEGLQPGSHRRLRHRDTAGDVGAGITLSTEGERGSVLSVVVANLRRVQESLRSLEEFGKLLDSEFAAVMKVLRYRVYVLEQRLCGVCVEGSERVGFARRARLRRSRLYVLITESQCRLSWQETVRLVLEGGADIVQLREKRLGDAELLRRAQWLCGECESAGALFVMNDRPDLAVLSGAAGVHTGQEELGAGECRRLVTEDVLVGLSTHSVSQLQAAVSAGADYAGVGPVFPSTTKRFEEFPGLGFVSGAAGSLGSGAVVPDFPWFAIGGITEVNVGDVLVAGARRVAVGAAVTASEDPRGVVSRLQSMLSEF